MKPQCITRAIVCCMLMSLISLAASILTVLAQSACHHATPTQSLAAPTPNVQDEVACEPATLTEIAVIKDWMTESQSTLKEMKQELTRLSATSESHALRLDQAISKFKAEVASLKTTVFKSSATKISDGASPFSFQGTSPVSDED